MVELAEFARSIAIRDLTDAWSGGEEIPISVLASLEGAIHADGTTAVHHCLVETLVRLAETHILSQPRLVRLVQLWDGIVGTAKVRIEGHLIEILGTQPPQELITHIFRCLGGSAAQRGRHSGAHEFCFSDLLRRVASASPSNQLRCEVCGYHFRIKDLSNDKVRTVLDAGLTFARSLFPGRSNDTLKPIQRKKDSFTNLSIDHVVPEETLGWSEPDNLEILCSFCNTGKMAFRRPLEALSSFAVGALCDVPQGRPFGTLKHQIIVAALRSQTGQCARCGRSKHEAELTVRPLTRTDNTALQGFAPWNLQTLCYTCVSAMPEDDGDDRPADSADLRDGESEATIALAEPPHERQRE